MSSIGTLYTVDNFPPGSRVRWYFSPERSLATNVNVQILAVAALADLKIDIAQGYKHYEDNRKPPFLDKFASGKIPAFEGKDGFTLFESSAIARYGES